MNAALVDLPLLAAKRFVRSGSCRTVIGCKNDDRILAKLPVVDRVKNASDALVHRIDHCRVGRFRCAQFALVFCNQVLRSLKGRVRRVEGNDDAERFT